LESFSLVKTSTNGMTSSFVGSFLIRTYFPW
jgi:hypothetical protein